MRSQYKANTKEEPIMPIQSISIESIGLGLIGVHFGTPSGNQIKGTKQDKRIAWQCFLMSPRIVYSMVGSRLNGEGIGMIFHVRKSFLLFAVEAQQICRVQVNNKLRQLKKLKIQHLI